MRATWSGRPRRGHARATTAHWHDGSLRVGLVAGVVGFVLSVSVLLAPPVAPADAEQQRLLFERGSELVTARADGGDERVLVDGRWSDPVWSPDGGQVAYVATDPETGQRAVRLVAAAGSDDRLVLEGLEDVGFVGTNVLDWSVDGERLVVGVEGEGLVTVRRDGTGLRELTSAPDSEGPTVGGELLPVIEHRVRWSPDGTRIAFVRSDMGSKRNSLWLVDADGADLESVVDGDDVGVGGLDWSPDGRRLAFHLVDEAGEVEDDDEVRRPADVYTVNQDGTDLRQLTHTDRARWPAWSPGGASLALAVGSGGGFEDERELFLVDADGANLRRVTSQNGSVARPSWSPDATRIAFTNWTCCVSGEFRPRAASEVFTVHADGTGLRQVTDDTRSRAPQFAPQQQDAPPAAFTDRPQIPEAHRANVDRAAAREVVSGFADGSFHPTLPARRDQTATLVAATLNAADVDLPEPSEDRFTDVAADSPHDEAVHRLAAAGIVDGGPAGLDADAFGPDLLIRRDQMASMLLRAAEFAAGDDLGSHTQAFADVAERNPHFAAVNGAAEAGLAQGFDDASYRPASDVRRDQMTTVVVRLLDHLQDADDNLSGRETSRQAIP